MKTLLTHECKIYRLGTICRPTINVNGIQEGNHLKYLRFGLELKKETSDQKYFNF